jgi:PAS domain S-box-containing protein
LSSTMHTVFNPNSNSLLSIVSERVSDPIFIKNCDRVLLFANPAALRQLGLTQQEALGRIIDTYITDPAQLQQAESDDFRVIQDGVSLTLEQTVQIAGNTRTFSTTKSPWYDVDGKVMGLVEIMSDITANQQEVPSPQERQTQPEAAIAERTVALQALINHIETTREQEKTVIVRELHDEMGAALTSLSVYLQGAYGLFPDDGQWNARKAKIQQLLTEVVGTTRRMQTRLRPTMLDLFGLKAAITELATEFSEQTSLECQLSLPDEALPANGKLDIALYRMLEEILNNVAKHASASKIDLILDVDEDRIALTVRDDGVGIRDDRLNDAAAYGLRGLRERAAFFGGTMTVRALTTGSQHGTTVVITIPLPAAEPNLEA